VVDDGCVIYQIYPRSFQDTTRNGIGDLPGITQRLDYLADTLGVGAIWISPFYPSPMADFGYDVSNYTSVDPMFGDIADFDALLNAAHDRGIKVIIDWVPNHTSDEHPWFVESRSSRDNPKRDWYTWRDPKPDGSPPNNWVSAFTGPAWNLEEHTGQYYLCTFTVNQADLNWRNPEVQDAMFEGLQFWLDRGVDGLRIDVAHFIMKDPELRDNPPATEAQSMEKDHGEYDLFEHVHDKGHADNHPLFRDVRCLLDSYRPERFAIGEIHIADWTEWASYYGAACDELHMPYNFSLLHSPWTATEIASRVDELEAVLPDGAWPNHVLGNHDEARLSSRFGPNSTRVAAMLLLTLRGTPTIYYGDELGIPQADIAPEDQQDPWGRNLPGAGRDGCRTPMQWDPSPEAGFSEGARTWLPLTPDWTRLNVASQLEDPGSILNLYRTLLRYREESKPLQIGDYQRLSSPDGCYLYERSNDSDRVVVALNFTATEVEVSLDATGTISLSTQLDRENEAVADSVSLRAHEGLIIKTG
jgi:alpha-glucosidase